METERQDHLLPFVHILQRIRMREDSRNAQTLYFPLGYERDLHVVLAESASQLVRRIVICANDADAAETFSDTVWREVVESGVECRQVLVLSHLGLLQLGVKNRAAKDLAAGIQVRVIAASSLPEDLAAATNERVILDWTVLARSPLGDVGQGATWSITDSVGQVRTAGESFDELWSLAIDIDSLPSRLSLEEPLVQSARTLADVAPVLCAGDQVDPHDCSWYHGTWQYLRLMGLVSTPTWHDEFYSRSIRSCLDDGARSFCITGTADYSVLAYVLHGFKSANLEPNVAVVDLCQTPLFASQWYAKRNGAVINLTADDVVRFSHSRRHFDVIVTDAFLTRFAGQEVVSVLEAWARMLAPGGRVVTTIRVHGASLAMQDPEAAIASFRERAETRWRRWEPFIPESTTGIAIRAESYARRMVSNIVGDADHIKQLLARLFVIESAELAEVPGELYPSRYLRVILRKEGS